MMSLSLKYACYGPLNSAALTSLLDTKYLFSNANQKVQHKVMWKCKDVNTARSLGNTHHRVPSETKLVDRDWSEAPRMTTLPSSIIAVGDNNQRSTLSKLSWFE